MLRRHWYVPPVSEESLHAMDEGGMCSCDTPALPRHQRCAPPPRRTMGAAKTPDEPVEAFLAQAPARSLYEVLGASPTDDAAALKKAYRKRCLAFHPDKNPHPRAADAFLLVSAASAGRARNRPFDGAV